MPVMAAILVAIAVNGEGYREILGICEGAKEDKAGWSAFLKHLKGRGFHGVRLIISDACMGLSESAAEFFPEEAWQRCIVHWYRNVFSHVPSTKVREVAAMLKAIHRRRGPRGGPAAGCPRDREAARPTARHRYRVNSGRTLNLKENFRCRVTGGCTIDESA
jgi:hypothetical protein